MPGRHSPKSCDRRMPTRNCLLPRMIRIPCQLTSLCGAGYTYVLPSFFTPLFKCPRPQVGAAQRLRTRCLLFAEYTPLGNADVKAITPVAILIFFLYGPPVRIAV